MLKALQGMLSAIADMKRVYVAGQSYSLAGQGFIRAWQRLFAGDSLTEVALAEAKRALAASVMAGLDFDVLLQVGLDPDNAEAVLQRAIRQAGSALPAAFLDDLCAASNAPALAHAPLPDFAKRLCEQPRAGATCPGKPRIMLSPTESHADHCYIVAVYAVLLSQHYGSTPALSFLAGLSHHFHNVFLPDAGFAAEAMLGEHLTPMMCALDRGILRTLPPVLAAQVRETRTFMPHAGTPEARAFHAADVLDRVLQMQYYERANTFRAAQALDDMALIHDGQLQAFGLAVARDAGLIAC